MAPAISPVCDINRLYRSCLNIAEPLCPVKLSPLGSSAEGVTSSGGSGDCRLRQAPRSRPPHFRRGRRLLGCDHSGTQRPHLNDPTCLMLAVRAGERDPFLVCKRLGALLDGALLEPMPTILTRARNGTGASFRGPKLRDPRRRGHRLRIAMPMGTRPQPTGMNAALLACQAESLAAVWYPQVVSKNLKRQNNSLQEAQNLALYCRLLRPYGWLV